MTTQRNENIKYEDMETNKAYAFTFAPSDKIQFWDDPDRFNKFKQRIITSFTSLFSAKGKVMVTIEVSPHGRLHLHGYLTIADKMHHYLYIVPQLEEYGTICIKQLTSDKEWNEYCTKQKLTEYIYIPLYTKPISKKKRATASEVRRTVDLGRNDLNDGKGGEENQIKCDFAN